MPPSPAAKKRKSEHHINDSATSLKDDIKGNPACIFSYQSMRGIFSQDTYFIRYFYIDSFNLCHKVRSHAPAVLQQENQEMSIQQHLSFVST